MLRDMTFNDLIHVQENKELVFIDVRSPSEYHESTIPGSINIPLFDDKERAEIGTIYKQVSVQAAKDRGLEIVSAKLPAFIKEFSKIPGEKVVFCWRGGMRSKTSATVLDLMGIRTVRLQGGYNAYRKWVVNTLEKMDLKADAYVLHGLTGTGKTAILLKLKEKGYPVLDLEGLANHRGSIFGQIGQIPNNQRTFDSLLVNELLQWQENTPYVLMEAESKRVGKVMLPDLIMKKKEQGLQLIIELPFEVRVQHILEDYRPWEYQKECIEAFEKIKNRIHTPIAAEIESKLHQAEYGQAVSLLLEYYYDPRYSYTADQYSHNAKITIYANSIDEATAKVEKVLKEKLVITN